MDRVVGNVPDTVLLISKSSCNMEDRLKTEVEFIKDGQSFKVGDLQLGVENPGVIEVIGWSQYTYFANLTKQQCLRELEEIKVLFYKMVDASPELKNFIKDKSVEFTLCFDDYGKGSIGLCSEKKGRIKWEVELK